MKRPLHERLAEQQQRAEDMLEVAETAVADREASAVRRQQLRHGAYFGFSALLAAGAVYLGLKDSDKSAPDARVAALRQTYKPNQLQTLGRNSFNALVELSPTDVQADTVADKQKIAESIQYDIAHTSSALLGTSKEFPTFVDEYDVAHTVIAPETLSAMADEDMEFTPVPPVDCATTISYGYSWSVYDYSNRLPKDFAVTAKQVDGVWKVNIPVGTAQLPRETKPYDPISSFASDYSPFGDTYNLIAGAFPCWEQPETGSLDEHGQPYLKQIY